MAQLGSEIETLNQVLSLLEAFKSFDSDNDGRITAAELGGILGSLGYKASEQEVRTMMLEGDKDKDGQLSIEEFFELKTKNMGLHGELANILRTTFEALDGDENGALTGQELYQIIGNLEVDLSLEECQEIVDSLDVDGDGIVSSEDFRLIVSYLL